MTDRELKAAVHAMRQERSRQSAEKAKKNPKPEPTVIVAETTKAAPAPKLVNDAHLAVELITLEPGARFKLPDSPRENLPGKFGTLIYANASRARVQFEGGQRTFTGKRRGKDGNEQDVEVTVEKSGVIDIAAGTMVVRVHADE